MLYPEHCKYGCCIICFAAQEVGVGFALPELPTLNNAIAVNPM